MVNWNHLTIYKHSTNVTVSMNVCITTTHGILIQLILIEVTPKIVAEAFYKGELENELRRINCIEYVFRNDSDREVCMDMIENVRRQNIYPHPASECTTECKSRGKRKRFSVDYC